MGRWIMKYLWIMIYGVHITILIYLLCSENVKLLRQRYYYATWKADGTRYMMLITMDGCYLIDRHFKFRRVQMRFPCRHTNEVCSLLVYSHSVSAIVLLLPYLELWFSDYCSISFFWQGVSWKDAPLYLTWWGNDNWHSARLTKAREEIFNIWYDGTKFSLYYRGKMCYKYLLIKLHPFFVNNLSLQFMLNENQYKTQIRLPMPFCCCLDADTVVCWFSLTSEIMLMIFVSFSWIYLLFLVVDPICKFV